MSTRKTNAGNLIRQRVLYIGDREAPEFREAVEWLATYTDATFACDIDPQQLRDGDPQCVIVAQQRPHRYHLAEIESIHRTVPLASTIALLGSWCEGETRTGKPWPGFTRVYWHQWRPRFESMLQDPLSTSALRLPRTASDVELLLASSSRQWKLPPTSVLLACDPRHTTMFLELLANLGISATHLRCDRVNSALGGDRATDSLTMHESSVLWVDTFPGLSQAAVSAWIDRVRPAATIVTMDFPRQDDEATWRRAGATLVLARPWSLDDLAWSLGHATTIKSHQPRRIAA